MKDSDANTETGPIDPFDEGSWTESERFYFERVSKLLNERADIRFSNGQPAHAVYLMKLFFQTAERRMRIFSGNLARRTEKGILLYENPHVISASANFLCRPGNKLMIVLEKDIDVDDGQTADGHPFIAEILKRRNTGDMKGSLFLGKARQEDLKFLRDKKFLHHLVIMDEQAWRIEIDPVPNRVKAQVNAGDRAGAQTLVNLFDKVLFRRAEKTIELLPLNTTRY